MKSSFTLCVLICLLMEKEKKELIASCRPTEKEEKIIYNRDYFNLKKGESLQQIDLHYYHVSPHIIKSMMVRYGIDFYSL